MPANDECETRTKVLVRKRKWQFLLKIQWLCFLGCSGYFSGSLSPSISIMAFNSSFCPFPEIQHNSRTFNEALVVIRFKNSSSNFPNSTTCRLLLVEPSFSATNWLLRKRSHPSHYCYFLPLGSQV